MAESRLECEVEAVCQHWWDLCTDGMMSAQSADKFGLLARRFAGYAAASGAETLTEVSAEVATGFITARGRSRHGHVSDSALATQHLRRTVLRALFRIARALDLADADPTMDINLPPKTGLSARPLTDEETLLVRYHTESRIGRTRHAAAVALAGAGAHTGEIGHLTIADLDLEHQRVWVHGSSKTTPRWCPLDSWQQHVLSERTKALRARHPRQTDDRLMLATSGRGSDAQLQARVCVALSDALTWAGLAREADLRPASITNHHAASLFAQTGRIEQVALRLGLSSLDRAATAIGYHWRTETQDERGQLADDDARSGDAR